VLAQHVQGLDFPYCKIKENNKTKNNIKGLSKMVNQPFIWGW
jgi:hypothetical protein